MCAVWLPDSAEDIERLAREGSLEETHHFDAKELPGRNPDVAVDVCAMTPDGGTLLYGVGEDDHGRPSRPAPFELDGMRERIDQIVATSILEPPTIVVTERPLSDDPSRGYLVVNVPQSARAPHQVVVGGDLRFYGRGATGNRRLTEPEVAALYARRKQWEVDRDRLLADVVSAPPVTDAGAAFIHAVARPVASDAGMLRRALGDDEMVLRNSLVRAANTFHVRADSDSGVAQLRQLRNWQLHGAEGMTIGDLLTELGIRYVLRMTIDHDGHAVLFGCAGFTDEHAKLLFVDTAAANLGNFLASAGALYEVGQYLGTIDVGVALTGMSGAIRAGEDPQLAQPFPQDDYRETDRVLVAELRDQPGALAERLLRRLLGATVAFDYSPWVPSGRAG